MNAIKRDKRTSIRVSSDILELAEDICVTRGYSKADIFEKGVLLMDNSKDIEQITSNQIYDEMIKRFEIMEKKVTMLHDELIHEIQTLKNKKNDGLEYSNEDVRMVVDSIINLIEKRIYWSKNGKTLEPLGKEFFHTKSKQYKVPEKVILEELSKNGYTTDHLLEIGINPHGRWEGLKKAPKESMV